MVNIEERTLEIYGQGVYTSRLILAHSSFTTREFRIYKMP